MEDALRAKTRGNRSPEGVIFYDTIGYCKSCGAKVSDPKRPCPECQRPLVYSGKELEYEPIG